MIVCNFNLSTAQLQVLLTFRNNPDTRKCDSHAFHSVSAGICVQRKLCQEGMIQWFDSDPTKNTRPGYVLTPKGEMFLRLVETELRSTLAWFDGQPIPNSYINPNESNLAAGTHETNKKGFVRPKKKTA